MKKAPAGWALAAVLLAACGVTTKVTPYETKVRPVKRAGRAIEVYDSSESVTRPFKVIGVVQAIGGFLSREDDLREKLVTEARALGGDAIVDVDRHAVGGGWSAKVIVWGDGALP